MATWTYKQTEPGLWTVGYYDVDGGWNPETDFHDPERAADRTVYLNGGNPRGAAPGAVMCADCDAILDHLGDGFTHLEETKHAGVRFLGASERVWSPIS